MFIDCDIVRDLLPMYKDGALSEKSRLLVSGHLLHCPNCRRYMKSSDIKAENGSASAECGYTGLAKRIRVYKTVSRVIIGIIIAALLGYSIYKTVQDLIK